MNDVANRGRRVEVFWLILGLSVVIFVPIAEVMTGSQLGFSVFYIIPVFLVSRYGNRIAGVATAVAAVGVWTLIDFGSEQVDFTDVVTFWRAGIRFGVFFSAAFLLSSLKASLDREKELAQTDGLTGAANTRHFLEEVSRELERSGRYARPFTLVYIDLDNFKAVNDQMGHGTGDEVLRKVATTACRKVRTVDCVGRLGGDEFAVLLPETDKDGAKTVLTKLQTVLLEAMQDNGWPVTFSLGGAVFLKPPESVEQAIKKADGLMYRAKGLGKNQYTHQVFGE